MIRETFFPSIAKECSAKKIHMAIGDGTSGFSGRSRLIFPMHDKIFGHRHGGNLLCCSENEGRIFSLPQVGG
jgi:hypothetical protein